MLLLGPLTGLPGGVVVPPGVPQPLRAIVVRIPTVNAAASRTGVADEQDLVLRLPGIE